MKKTINKFITLILSISLVFCIFPNLQVKASTRSGSYVSDYAYIKGDGAVVKLYAEFYVTDNNVKASGAEIRVEDYGDCMVDRYCYRNNDEIYYHVAIITPDGVSHNSDCVAYLDDYRNVIFEWL